MIQDNMNFNYLAIPQCDAGQPRDRALARRPGLRRGGRSRFPASTPPIPACALNSNTAFGEDIQRGYKQIAFFASVDFDMIPKVLTLTGGTRHYQLR